MDKLKYHQLNERESNLLRIVIEDYIAENRPVASNNIKLKYDIPFSPATIRNILARLEFSGFLNHAHTSSGRVPTDLGYRYYVDNVINQDEIETGLFGNVREQLLNVSANVDELMQGTALMLAKISGLFGVVIISEVRRSILTEIELVSLSSDRLLMVIALKSGLLKSLVLNLDISVSPSDITIVNRILRERLIGLSVDEIQSSISDLLKNYNVPKHEIIQIIFQHPQLPFQLNRNNQLYMSSYKGLFSYPEFQEYGILQKTISGLNEKYIKRILSSKDMEQNMLTIIGNEGENDLLNHCSIIASRFESDSITGKLGIFGPTRIPYKNIIRILKEFVEIMPNVC
ncbi:heat-inducible transcriptional repressor HrcA [bacterium]|nr:heat-inducible transcriptional repressor HrcA [bacterium]